MKMKTIHKKLIGALFLAITAPTETKSAECVAIADGLAAGMSNADIEACKSAAALAAQVATKQFIAERSAAN